MVADKKKTHGQNAFEQAQAEIQAGIEEMNQPAIMRHKDLMKSERLPANIPLSYKIFLDSLRHNIEGSSLKGIVEEMVELYCKEHPEHEQLAKIAVDKALEVINSQESAKIKAAEAKIQKRKTDLKRSVMRSTS